MKISKKLIHSNIDRMMETDKSDQRNLKVLPEPFSSSDLSLFGIETEVSFNDVLLREKVVVVGDECVGKSSILKSHLKKSDKIYDKNYLMTKGIELEVSEIPVPNSDIVVDLFLYDMGGQSIFNQRQMAKRYWENCSNIICVYDVSSRKSLQSVMTWVTSVRSASTARQDIPVILVANKIDLREVSSIQSTQLPTPLPIHSTE
jgi:small GTP-binding protein